MTAQPASEPLPFDPASELDRQLQNLIALGYPQITGLGADELRDLVEPLRAEALARSAKLAEPTPGRVPFVLVVPGRVAPPDRSVLLTSYRGQPGFVSADTADINRFRPIEGVDVPTSDAYLIIDVDRGRETLNASPDEAVAAFAEAGRSPLTIDEGIAFITAFPEALEKNNCFQTAGSRVGDRRVPGLWISARRPKLGYCWAGNRHTWLGAASCRERVGD